jgi:outer membrane autotransporter protein
MTPQEAVDLVSGYNDREEMLDAQLANPALQERENFWRFAYDMAGMDLESNQSFTDATRRYLSAGQPQVSTGESGDFTMQPSSGNISGDNLPMTPQEAVDLVSGYNDREEMLDAQLANPALQERENFWHLACNIAGRDLESNQSFVNAVMNAAPQPAPLLSMPAGSSSGVGTVGVASQPAPLLSMPVGSSSGGGAVGAVPQPVPLVGAVPQPAPILSMPVGNSYINENPEFWPEFWPNRKNSKEQCAVANVSTELAYLTLTVNTLLTNAIADRLVSVKGCLADPFVHIIYGYAHQNKITGLGYNNHMGGFVMGLDDIWTFTNERYLRMGIAFGYTHGKTNFSGPAVSYEKSAKHSIYTVELFGAYEFFNDRHLKANVGVTIGYSQNDDRLHRVDLGSNVFDAKVRSDNFFMGIEFIKNLYVHKGYQFGPWFRANYSHIAQKGYDESTTAAAGAQHVSAVSHDFLTTVVGFNVEKEILDLKLVDRKLTLSLKTGWEYQAVRKYSNATISFDNNLGIGKFAPTFRHPLRSAAIISLGASQKLDIHWSIVSSYIARLNKDISTHNFSVGVEYSY